MAKGDGSIFQLGKNHWKVRVDFGKDPVTGKRQVVSRNIHGTKADARKVRDQIRSEKENGIKANAGKITLSDFIIDWAEAKRVAGRASERTIQGERASLRHVEKHLGSKPIKDIDPQMVECTYAKIKTEDRLSGTTLNKIHISLKNVFKKAADYGLITRNPCDHVEAPCRDKKERRSLTREEFIQLSDRLDEAEEKAYESLAQKEVSQMERGNAFGRSFIRGIAPISFIMTVRLALSTGMRRGEILGLVWNAIDLNRRTICVRQSLTNEGAIKAPKTQSGIRTISIDDNTVSHLIRWRTRQAVELSKFGVQQTGDTPVCCSNVGSFLNGSNFEHWWTRFRAECGFPDLKFHELRHTQASLLVAAGTNLKTVQERLGHSSASITLNWYAHSLQENDLQAAQEIESLFEAEPEAPRVLDFEELKSA